MENNKEPRAVDAPVDSEITMKQPDGSMLRIHPYTKEENLLTGGKKPLRKCKFDDVETYVDEESEENVMNFFADGEIVKTVTFTGGGGLKGGTITSSLPERMTIKENEVVVIPYVFDTPNRGEATLYVSVVCGEKSKEIEFPIKKVGAGTVNIGTVDKGYNEISVYAVDFLGQMTNVFRFVVVCGALEITSTFDDVRDFNTYSPIYIPFNVSSLDKNEEKVLTVDIDGREFTKTAVEGYNSYTYPDELKTTGIHHVTLKVTTKDFTSNLLEYDIVIVDASQILVSSKNSTMSVEEGTDIKIEYRISTIGHTMFNVTYLVDGQEYKHQDGKLGINTFTGPYVDFPKGNHTVTIRVSTIDGNISGELTCNTQVTPSSFKRIEFVKPGLQAHFNMSTKSNQDKDRNILESEVLTDSGKRAVLELHDYNYSTNGWIDGRLVNNGISWAEVKNFLPLEDNVPNGFTFEIQFESSNAGDNDAVVVDCTGDDTPYKGFKIDSEKALLITESNKLKTFYTDKTNMRISFVVNRKSTYIDKDGTRKPNPMVQTYVNGMFTDVAMLSDTGSGSSTILESIANSNSILLNTDKSHKLFGNNKIKTILVYNRALEHEEILQNLMADIDNIVEQKRKYDKNYVTINQDLPTMYFNDTEIGKHENMTKSTKQWINITYVSPNVELYGPSFDLVCQTSWQGTSSLAYPIKNYKFKAYDYLRDEEGNIIEESKNDPKTYKKQKLDMFSKRDGNGYPETTFCLKADYMDSSHCRNTGTARLVNDFLFDGNPNPAKKIDPKTRDTINGFPIQLYVNGEWIGIYNFNHDKSCTKSLGLETIPHTVRWEIKANSDTSEGAFHVTWDKNDVNDIYKKILADFEIVYDEDAFEDETGEYDVTKYYDEIGIPHDGTVMGTYKDYAILSLARFINFVGKTEDKEEFRRRAPEYFDIKQACRYYLNVMTLGMIDNFAKNCIINMYGDDIWWFNFYDMDSSMGLDNTGYNKFETNIEPNQPNIYNCATSKMWVKLNDWMDDYLFDEFKLIRENKYTYENICKYLIETQIDIIPEIAYNRDQYSKYISQGRQYLHMLHGNNKDHLLRWLHNRFQYVDSLFLQNSSPYTKQSITIRANKPLDIPEEDPFIAKFEIETYCPQYVTIAWRKNTYETKRIDFGETITFEKQMVNSTDNEIIIYCAGNLKRIGDITRLRPTSIDIGMANRLIELKCEDSDVLVKTDLSKNDYLREVSFKNCSRLGTASGGSNILDVSKCTNLRKVDVRGTQITSILSNVDGGNLEEVLYSERTQSIVLSKQTNLRLVGVPYGYNNIWSGLAEVHKGQLVTYDPSGNSFNMSPNTDSYVVLKNYSGKGAITTDNLWEVDGEEVEIIRPKNGSTTRCYFFDSNKHYIDKTEVEDRNSHNEPEITKFAKPRGAKYCMVSVSFSRPMSLDENLSEFAIVKAGDREFRKLKDLNNVQISNCKNIEKISLYSGFVNLNNIFTAIQYTQDLTIDNSLNMESLTFNGFQKLRNLTMKNMLDMKSLGFDNMISTYATATLHNVTIVNCPLITKFTMNVSDEEHSIRFADGATLDISGLTSADTLETNYSIKGLKTLILPTQLKHLLFGNEFGDGETTILNIFSTDAVGDHAADEYEGIDFKNMVVETINMEGLTAIKNGLNFNIKPIDQHPNMNTSRTGTSAKPWFRPEGTVNLSEYISEMDGMFKGCDMTKLNIIIDAPTMRQTNLNSLFANSIVDNVNIVNKVISKFPKASNMEKLLINSTPIDSIEGIQLPSTIKNLNQAFKGCKDLLSDIRFPEGIINVTEAFRDCTSMTKVTGNWNTEYTNDIQHENCYMNCATIETIDDSPATLNEVPREWGGYGFDSEVTMLCEINTVKAGTKTIRLYDNEPETIHVYTDWGDGTIDDKFVHTYARDNIYSIKTQRVSKNAGEFHKSFKQSLVRVSQMPNQLIKYNSLFKGCSNLIEAEFTINNKVNSLYQLFDGCRALETVRINLPTACTDLSYTFRYCGEINDLSFISDWDVSKVTVMPYLFMGCTKAPSLDVSKWQVGKCTNFRSTFQDCGLVTELAVENWDISNAYTISGMFSGCYSLREINVKNWNVANVTEANNLFQGCSALKSVDMGGWQTGKFKTISFLFQNCSELETVEFSDWDTSEITNMMCLFQNCYSLAAYDISSWNTSKVLNLSYAFANIQQISTIDLSMLNLNALTNTLGMFAYASGVDTIKMGDMSNARLTSASGMFQGCYRLNTLDVSTFNVSGVANLSSMFQDCNVIANLNVSNWDVSNCVNMNSMFAGCYNLSELNVSNWVTDRVVDMTYLFQNCRALETLDISRWNTDNLAQMQGVFQGCAALTVLDVSRWNTSRIESFTSIFEGCSNVQSLNLSGWNTARVTDLVSTFNNCKNLTSLNVTGWNVLKVNSFNSAFNGCTNLSTLDLTSFDLVNANNHDSLSGIFTGCVNLGDIKSPKNINSNITIPDQREKQNLVDIINNLYDRSSSTSLKLTLNANNLDKLEPSDIAIATNKNWSVV